MCAFVTLNKKITYLLTNKSVSCRLVPNLLYFIFKCLIANRLILSVAHDSIDCNTKTTARG